MALKNQLKVSNKNLKKYQKQMKFIVKTHQGPHGEVLVVSDQEILGKRFSEGKLQLNLTKEFYQGKEMEDEQVKAASKSAYILHLTGENSINLFSDLIDKDRILIVEKIPHAEVYLAEN